MDDFRLIHRHCHQKHAYDLEQQIRTIHFRCRFSTYLQLSLPYFYLPQFDIQNGKEWPRACVLFWLPLELGERIERLGLAVHRVFRLKSGGFGGGNANRTNLVLLKIAITERSGQKANQFEHVCNVQRGN